MSTEGGELILKDEAGQPRATKIQEEACEAKTTPKNKIGRWRRKEHGKYLSFLRKYYYIMRDSGLRYHYRIFNRMSEAIGTRNSTQCKSHHQKMLKKYRDSLETIVFNPGLPGDQTVTIGEGETHLSHTKIVKEAMKFVEMGKQPYLTLKVDEKLLIVINEELVANY